jgi:hypothetical protein
VYAIGLKELRSNAMPDSPTPAPRSRRGPFCVGCTMALLFVAAGAMYYVNAATARRWVVGPPDPKTGTRIRYRTSPRYTKQPMPSDEASNRTSVAEEFKYSYHTPPRSIQWLEDHHLFSPGRKSPGDEIQFVAAVPPMMIGWGLDRNGFVDIDTRRFSGMAMFGVVSQEKRLVADCPTSLIVEDLPDLTPAGHASQVVWLVLHPKGDSMSYIFSANGIEGEKDNPDVQELKAIRESVQLEGRK